ncbi:MAG: hypothetical protein ACR2HJ_05745 [Fimbriimonadales bacterium]
MFWVQLTILAAASGAAQDGHSVVYKRQPSIVEYKFNGEVLSTYVGAIDAPPTRQVQITGTYVLKTENRGSKWVVVGLTDKLKVTKVEKGAGSAQAKLALKGVWTQVVAGPSSYTLKGAVILPTQLNAPLWPIAWVPISPAASMKIGDEFTQTFEFPAQAFLEDDPIGRFTLPLSFVFNGSEYPSSKGLYSFSLRASHDVDQAVKHPEDPALRLKGHILVDGRLKVSRSDGRLESANVIMSADLWLEGKNYPFGFSKAKGSVTATLERIK